MNAAPLALLSAVAVALAACSAQPANPQASPAASASGSPPKGGPASVGLTEAQKKRGCECGVWDLERQMKGAKLSPAEAKEACITNVDCVLTFEVGDCAPLVECNRGEPGRMPTCRPGYAMQPMNQCLKACPDGACPAGEACDKGSGEPLCRPK